MRSASPVLSWDIAHGASHAAGATTASRARSTLITTAVSAPSLQPCPCVTRVICVLKMTVWLTCAHLGYNVGIGYANCNHPADERPEVYDPPGGNGAPTTICGSDPGSVCPSPGGEDGCSADSLTVTSQESVTCNEYLGPAYIGAGSLYTFTTTRTIGTTWNVGGFAGLNIGRLGQAIGMPAVTFSWSETVSTGDTAGANGQCGEELGKNGMPGNWT